MIRVSAFKWVPPFAQGQVRDLRVRWALEEAGIAYEENLLGFAESKAPPYRALQPFGQVPAYEEDGLALFESGAIVFHIAEKAEVLMPRDPRGRARAISWMFAALNSVEPLVQELGGLDAFHGKEEWARLRKPSLIEALKKRLGELADALGDRDWLEGRFTAADILMVTVLRILDGDPVYDGLPTLKAYIERGKARPAFQRALDAQCQPFQENAPA
jgi:glutathione S-transferase